MKPDDMPWLGSRVLEAPTWIRRITAYADPDEPIPFADIVSRFRALEHLSAPLDEDTPVTEQLEALVAKQSGLRSLNLGQRRKGARTAALSGLSLDYLGCSAGLLRDAASPWSEGLSAIPNLKINAREMTSLPGPAPWENLRACESLELRRIEVDAALLAALATLPALRRLNLSMCAVAPGSVAALAGCPSLERLTILGSTISAEDAAALAKAPKLSVVVSAIGGAEDALALRPIAEAGVALGVAFLPRNPVDDGLIASIVSELPSLAGLRLSQTRCSKLTPDGLAKLGGLTSLRWLNLSGISVGGLRTANLGFLSELTSLRALGIADMGKISAAVIGALAGATELRELDLRSVPVSDAAAKKLSKLSLERLAISEAKIGPKGMASLATISTLEELSIDHAKGFSDAMLAALAPAPALTSLDLKTSISANISPTDLEPLAGLPQLRTLGVAEVGITDAWLESLSSTPSLEALRFTRSDFSFSGGRISEASIESGFKVPSLQTISHWSFVPSEEMDALIESTGHGAWTPADYRSFEVVAPEDAPIEA